MMMPKGAERDTTIDPGTTNDAHRGDDHPPENTQLERRQKRNTDLTEQSQRNPGGGAHSDAPNPTNP